MLLLWLLAALAFLLATYILTLLRHRPFLKGRRTARPQIDGRIAARVRRLLRRPSGNESLIALHRAAPLMLEHLRHFQQACRHLPPLPVSDEGEPRLMDLARDVADSDSFEADTFLHALQTTGATLYSAEVSSFPYLVAAAQCQRFGAVVKIIAADNAEYHAAHRLAKRLLRGAPADALLEKAALNSIGLAALLKALQDSEQEPLVEILTRWLTARGISAEHLAACYADRQARVKEEILRTLDCFDALQHLRWYALCQDADPLHHLLEEDPAHVYPRMSRASQLQLRRQVACLSCAAHVPEEYVARMALSLSEASDTQSPERYIGFWLQTQEGLYRLHRRLGTKRGFLYFHLSPRRDALERTFLTCFGIGCGILFLQLGQPVLMLPFFLIVTGSVSRQILRHFPAPALPAINSGEPDHHIRTLVVLHAVLLEQEDAHHALQQLQILRHTFDGAPADFLLLADFTPCMTATSGQDGYLVHAVSSALPPQDSRIMYLQRGRTWDAGLHLYAAPHGLCGALLEICRLVALGEHDDPIAYSSLPPADFERKYAYILSLPSGVHPAPDMLQRMLQRMAHPLCLRYPDVRRPRGYSILLPEETPQFTGVGLIRPDAFVEAADSRVSHADQLPLCGVLAGQARGSGAHVRLPEKASPWETAYRDSIVAWRLFLWQLPWVQTSAGLITNPLHASGRFRLRELLRDTLTPLGQVLLMLWAVLTENLLLLLAVLLLPELRCFRVASPLRSLFSHLALLPTRMVVRVTAILRLLQRKSNTLPDWSVLLLWSQLLAATLMGALGFIVSSFALPCFALCALFAAFPLANDSSLTIDEKVR